MELSDTQLAAPRSHLCGAVTRSGAFPTAPATPSQGVGSAWDREALLAQSGVIEGEGATLERLGAVVAELFKALSSALQDERESAKVCIQRASDILQADQMLAIPVDEVLLSIEGRVKPIRGGLAPWQIRKVTTHIESNLDSTIQIKDLATLINISSFHFCRAFRDSFGDSPHGYIMRRRVERAQGLMLTTNAPLGQIAAECGLADQAHFNKLFRRFVGESPGAWRRARASAPA
jgi:AraC family transcriptional regulator